ncbi:MAG: NifB/NifX family molybdenum-iron cluster-binding protein [Lentisphaeria bacterium]|nr:NifB/NifX family molybdenum-iron cluster-binding protein [Lentisphaeria bacterium]
MMRIALAVLNNRIAPVFDTARHLIVFDDNDEKVRREVSLIEEVPLHRARQLADIGVNVLICGAVSRPLRAMIQAWGVEIHPFVSGDVTDILQAYRDGRLDTPDFAMPGCRGMRHQHAGGRPGACRRRRGRD